MISDKLKGQTAIITGGTSGIGREITKTLADRGADVVPVSRTESKVKNVVDELGLNLACPTDVRNKRDVETLFKKAEQEYGSINILVNSAGIFFDESPVTELSKDDWLDIVETNLFGTFVTTQYFPTYSGGENQTVVNISSIAGEMPLEGLTTYTSTKFGVNGLTKSLALEYADKGIRVNAVAPGYVKTAQNKERLEKKEVKNEMFAKTPLGRYATLEEVASAATFLASPSASFITGEVLTVDGGYSLTNL